MIQQSLSVVIAGLDPAIHERFDLLQCLMDARVKPGYDAEGGATVTT
jgi:hypothetical protein